MPPFFSFDQGTETHPRHNPASDASPLLGRFRAVPRRAPGAGAGAGGGYYPGLFDGAAPARGPGRGRQPGLLSRPPGPAAAGAGAGWRGSVHVGYGAVLLAAELEDDDEDEDEDGGDGAGRGRLARWARRWARKIDDIWVTPKQSAVRRVADKWWSRWFVLVVLPAALAVAWCAIPFPQYPLPDSPAAGPGGRRGAPGHGEARVQVNFWFFLFVYYGFYNLTALIWITKVFNLYSLNWWPASLGFPLTVCAIAVLSLAAPIPVYLAPEARFLTVHNTAWISWTFVVMAMPVAIAFCILMTNERHLSLRHSLSETQRIFTSSWWTGEPDAAPGRRGGRRRRWLPASFVRFVWFCTALFIGLMTYAIGEAYAEIYLRTLPHDNLETIVYVYGWILTVFLLDALTGWILGGNEGERVGSYPLSWIFKLYFMLTYQTYVRALYARLRSPSQFVLLQVLSSSSLIVLTPLLLSPALHRLLTALRATSQSYGAWQKVGVRNVFIRLLAENASMLAFLGAVAVLHFGPNRDVYPYFAFEDAAPGDPDEYTFGLTFWASSVTWACELAASLVVAGLIRCFYGVGVVAEGKLDLAVWPELLPTAVAVMLHVLQNMIFSIVRLQFH